MIYYEHLFCAIVCIAERCISCSLFRAYPCADFLLIISRSCSHQKEVILIVKLRNYFSLPNEIFSLDLCAAEIAVYAYLIYREDRKTFTCHPSLGRIGKALHMSKNTVSKYVRSLERKCLIETRYTTYMKDGICVNGNLEYKLLPIKRASAQHMDRQMQRALLEQQRQQNQRRLEAYDNRHRKRAGDDLRQPQNSPSKQEAGR